MASLVAALTLGAAGAVAATVQVREELTRTSRRLDARPNSRGRAILASGRCLLVRLKITGTGDDSFVETVFRLGRRCRPPAPLSP